MSLDFANVSIGTTWQQRKTNTGFADTVQGPDGLSLNLSYPVGSTNANSIYIGQGTLSALASTTIDLFSFTDKLGQSVSMTRVYSMVVKTTGDRLQVSPGATNPLLWPFPNSTHSVVIPAGGAFAICQPTPFTVSSTARNIKLENYGSVSLTYDIAIIGGP